MTKFILTRRLCAVVALVCLALAGSIGAARAGDADNGAPFGLSWGMSPDQVKAMNVTLADSPVKDYGASFTATQLPKVVGDIDTIILSFGYDNKLWRIVAIGKTVANDPYGNQIMSRYGEIEQALTEKYGKGAQHHHFEANPYTHGSEFMMKVKQGEAWHYTDFKTDQLNVQLILGATSFSDSYYRIIYVNNALGAQFEKAKKGREKDAL